MKLSLLVREGPACGQVIPIPLAQFLIGRDVHCHLRPRSPLVSKRHCAIVLKQGRTYICDLNSTNGTFLNGERVEGEKPVRNGDVLRLGPLVFQLKIETRPEPPAPPTMPRDEDSIAKLLLDSGVDFFAAPAANSDAAPDDDTVSEIPSADSLPQRR